MKAFILGFLSTGIALLLLIHITDADRVFAKVFMRDMRDTIYKRDAVFLSSPLPNQNSNTEDQDVKPGQVWIYQSGDPFEPIRDVRTVIAVKDGWVQYRRVTGGIDSWPLDFFKIGSHLKK